jgi:hypothetical protein
MDNKSEMNFPTCSLKTMARMPPRKRPKKITQRIIRNWNKGYNQNELKMSDDNRLLREGRSAQ